MGTSVADEPIAAVVEKLSKRPSLLLEPSWL